MKAYILCFVLTTLFTYLAEKNFKKENKKIGIILSIIAVFIPTFICGIRKVGVGRDIKVYVIPALKQALKSSLPVYLKSYIAQKNEIGYMIFVYVISKFSPNLNVLLFFIQLIPCLSVFIFAYYYRDKVPMWFVMLVYLLTWYLRSYTMMRQSIAVGLIMISILTFEKSQIKTTLLLFILAILFHKSSIVAVGIYFIIWLCNTKKITNQSKLIIFISMLISICVVLYSYESVLKFFVYDLKILPQRFAGYLDSEYSNDEIQISFTETVFRAIFIVFGFVYYLINKKKQEKDINFIKFYLFYLISMGPYIISFKVINAERMNYYYYYPALLYIIPSLLNIVKKDKFNQIIVSTALISILFVFWFHKYPIKKNCETYPYKTEIVKFLN